MHVEIPHNNDGKEREEEPPKDREGALKIANILLDTRVPADTDDGWVPQFIEGAALQVGGERKSKVEDGHQQDLAAQQDTPLFGETDEPQKEEADGDFGKRRAHHEPRLAEPVKLERVGRVDHGATLDDSKDGADKADNGGDGNGIVVEA